MCLCFVWERNYLMSQTSGWVGPGTTGETGGEMRHFRVVTNDENAVNPRNPALLGGEAGAFGGVAVTPS